MEPLGLGAVLVTAQYVAIHPQPSYNFNSLVFFCLIRSQKANAYSS